MWLHETRLGPGQAIALGAPPSPRLPQTQIALMTMDASISIEPNALAVVLAVAGHCIVDAPDGRTRLRPRHFLVCDPGERNHVQLLQRGIVVVLSFSPAALRRLDTTAALRPLPGLGRLGRAALGTLCSALRSAGAPTASFWQREPSIRALLRHLAEVQVELRGRLAACPGKSYWRKTQVMLRLQRARRFLETHSDRIVRMSELAELTSFSHWYFTKTFHRVYGESPKSYATQMRLERAQRLLRQTDTAVGEVAAACGFESHSAFSRAYRQRFGTSATQTRRGAAQASTSAQMPVGPAYGRTPLPGGTSISADSVHA